MNFDGLRHAAVTQSAYELGVLRFVDMDRYIDAMYDDTMHRCHAENIDICSIKGTFILALSTFSYNVRICITTNACILVQSRVRSRYKDCPFHSLFQNLHLSPYLSLLPLLACTYLNNA